jgi:hypothetical protein
MSNGFDCVTEYLVKHKIPLTQRNWIEFAYFGDKHSIDELEGEERADLPEGLKTGLLTSYRRTDASTGRCEPSREADSRWPLSHHEGAGRGDQADRA